MLMRPLRVNGSASVSLKDMVDGFWDLQSSPMSEACFFLILGTATHLMTLNCKQRSQAEQANGIGLSHPRASMPRCRFHYSGPTLPLFEQRCSNAERSSSASSGRRYLVVGRHLPYLRVLLPPLVSPSLRSARSLPSGREYSARPSIAYHHPSIHLVCKHSAAADHRQEALDRFCLISAATYFD